jgi:hypothetical protein
LDVEKIEFSITCQYDCSFADLFEPNDMRDVGVEVPIDEMVAEIVSRERRDQIFRIDGIIEDNLLAFRKAGVLAPESARIEHFMIDHRAVLVEFQEVAVLTHVEFYQP